MGQYRRVAANVKRDNHWSKDHNGIWQRRLKLEGPRTGFAEGDSFENIMDFSAGPFQASQFWDETTDIDTWEHVASCIEGGHALKATSTTIAGTRIHSYDSTGDHGSGIEVMSGIYEILSSDAGQLSGVFMYDKDWGNGTYVAILWASRTKDTADPDSIIVDSGIEDLGAGPNGGDLYRVWMAVEPSRNVDWDTYFRKLQWRVDNSWSAAGTAVLHHTQYIEVASGYSASDNGAPSSIIVTNEPEENPVLWGTGLEDETAAFTTDFTSKNEQSGAYAEVAGIPYLSLPGISGNGASAPYIAAHGITGDMEIRVDILLPDITPSPGMLFSRFDTSEQDFSFKLSPTGSAEFVWGASWNNVSSGNSLADEGFVSGNRVQLRWRLDIDDGGGDSDYWFYYKQSGALDSDTGWTQFGTGTEIGGMTITDTGPDIWIGSRMAGTSELWAGRVFRAMLYDGMSGAHTVEFDANFEEQLVGDVSFTESSVNASTVTVNQSGTSQAEIVTDNVASWHGDKHALITFDGVSTGCTLRKDSLGNLSEVWLRDWFMIEDWGQNAVTIFQQLRSSDFSLNMVGRIIDVSGWRFQLFNTVNYGQIGLDTGPFAEGVWHEAVLHYKADTDGTDGVGEMWVNDTLIGSSSTEDFDLKTIDKVWLGISDSNTPASGAKLRYDDVRVETYRPPKYGIRRETEQFSIPITFNPQELSVYARFTQRWRDADHTVFSIGGGSGARFKVTNNNGSGGTFFVRYHDGTSSVSGQFGGGAIDWGDTVEIIAVLWDDGKVRGYQSINGGAWTTAGDTAALALVGSWGENLVHIGSIDDSNNSQGFIELEAFKIVNVVVYNTALAEWLRGYKE